MNEYENMLQEAADKGLHVIEWDFSSDKIDGLYCDGTIAIRSSLPDSASKACVLAEEIAHHDLTVGDIVLQKEPRNRHQEYQARMLAYHRFASPEKLAEALQAGHRTTSSIADYLGITEEFLVGAIEGYRSKYGLYTKAGDCILLLQPTIGILHLTENNGEPI